MQEIVAVYVPRDRRIIHNFRSSDKHFRARACANVRVICILVIHHTKDFASAI